LGWEARGLVNRIDYIIRQIQIETWEKMNGYFMGLKFSFEIKEDHWLFMAYIPDGRIWVERGHRQPGEPMTWSEASRAIYNSLWMLDSELMGGIDASHIQSPGS
jgi:hypothetical protein